MKGQAAMEYLVTYGWALLILIGIITALLASGMFSASAFVQQECTFQPGFQCWPFMLYKTDATHTTLSTTFHNGFGYPIKIIGINYTVDGIGAEGPRTVAYGGAAGPAIPVLKQGDITNITQEFPGSVQPVQGEIKKIIVSVRYTNCATASTPACSDGANHTISGRVVARVEG